MNEIKPEFEYFRRKRNLQRDEYERMWIYAKRRIRSQVKRWRNQLTNTQIRGGYVEMVEINNIIHGEMLSFKLFCSNWSINAGDYVCRKIKAYDLTMTTIDY